MAACAADCVAATAGFGVRDLFWCAGCQGSVYPLTGDVPYHLGGVRTAALIAQQRQAAGTSRWGDKPHYSAKPMEKLAETPAAASQGKEYLCPRCREGRLRYIRGKNGAFWGCTNYPRCTATFDDNKGQPMLDA